MNQSSYSINQFELQPVADPIAFADAVAWLRTQPALALDLEFDRNRYTYGFTLCLVQVATQGQCFLIDPQAIADLTPLWNLLADPAQRLLMHCGNEDVRLLKTLGCQPRNLYDTDVAARVLNYERTSLSQLLLQLYGIEISKSSQTSNWNHRPLTEKQLHYAATDVVYLFDLQQRLEADITALGRTHWMDEEMARLAEVAEDDSPYPHLQMKGAVLLSPFDQHVLGTLFAQREAVARHLNRPPYQVMANETLLRLATDEWPTWAVWQSLPGLHATVRTRAAFEQWQALGQTARHEAQAQQLARRPVRQFSRRSSASKRRTALLQRVQGLLTARFGEHAARLLLTSGLIREIAEQGQTLAVLKGYARQVIEDLAREHQIDLSALH